MSKRDKLVKVFTGTEVSVMLLQSILEESGVSTLVQNDFMLGLEVGFVGGVQTAIDLFIQESDLQKAEPIINDFIKNNG